MCVRNETSYRLKPSHVQYSDIYKHYICRLKLRNRYKTLACCLLPCLMAAVSGSLKKSDTTKATAATTARLLFDWPFMRDRIKNPFCKIRRKGHTLFRSIVLHLTLSAKRLTNKKLQPSWRFVRTGSKSCAATGSEVSRWQKLSNIAARDYVNIFNI